MPALIFPILPFGNKCFQCAMFPKGHSASKERIPHKKEMPALLRIVKVNQTNYKY